MAVAAVNLSITIIWYFAVWAGKAPAITCPVIIPGMISIPTEFTAFMVGIRPADTAIRMLVREASPGETTRDTSMVISSERLSR